MSETNKEVVRKIEEAWDSNNLDALDAMFAIALHDEWLAITGARV